jgi:hypothetical protein
MLSSGMTWNYRIVRYKNEDAYGLHEVFYNRAGGVFHPVTELASFIAVHEARRSIGEGDDESPFRFFFGAHIGLVSVV